MARARCRAVQAEHGPQLGCPLGQDSRLAHERSTSSEMNKIRCQIRCHTVKRAHLNAGLAVGHPKCPRECTLPSYRFHHVAARSCTRAKPELAAAALTHLWHFSKPSEKRSKRTPPIVFFLALIRKSATSSGPLGGFSDLQGGLCEDPKKRHQKLRKPAELRLCRSRALLALALCLTRESRRSKEVPVLLTLTDSTESTPEVPAIASRLTRSIGCGIHIRSSRCSR